MEIWNDDFHVEARTPAEFNAEMARLGFPLRLEFVEGDGWSVIDGNDNVLPTGADATKPDTATTMALCCFAGYLHGRSVGRGN